MCEAGTDVVDEHRRRHAEVGTTYHIRFERDVSFDQMEAAMDAVTTLLYDQRWDCFVSAGRPE